MERTFEIDTGESVAFSYELAGLGSRFLAILIDTCIQIGFAIGLALFAYAVVSLPIWKQLSANPHLAKITAAASLGLGVLAYFLLLIGYFILFEWLGDGRTPGKRLIGIRVVRDGGFPLDFGASIIRNLVRILEFSLGGYLISALVVLVSPRNQRLGDLAAGTLVVRDQAFETTFPIAGELRTADPLLYDLTSADFTLIESYLARCTSLTSKARRELAEVIAARVRPRFGARFDHLDAEALLLHLDLSTKQNQPPL